MIVWIRTEGGSEGLQASRDSTARPDQPSTSVNPLSLQRTLGALALPPHHRSPRQWFKPDEFRAPAILLSSIVSTQLGSCVSLSDGGLYLGTPVDPLFVLLPVLEAGAKKSLDKPQGNFCPLDDLAQEAAAAFPQLPLLMKAAKPSLPLICQVRN